MDVISNQLDRNIYTLNEQKFSTTIKVIYNKHDFCQRFDPILRLKENKNYKATLVGFSTYHAIQNIIVNENDQFKYSADLGTTWKTITLHPGSSESDSSNIEIKRQMSVSDDDETALHFNAVTAFNRISLTLDDKS